MRSSAALKLASTSSHSGVFGDEVAAAINGSVSSENRVQPFAVVMVLPFVQLLFEVVGLTLDPRPELLQRVVSGALDFAVELR